MRIYDFNAPLDAETIAATDRTLEQNLGRANLIPMWVADMNMRCADEIVDALERRARRAVYGYGKAGEDFHDELLGWFDRRHGLKLQKEWIGPLVNVVTGLCVAVSQFSQPGERIVLLPPVYPAFRMALERMGRIAVTCPLVRDRDGRYTINFDALNAALSGSKVLLFCSPHNPVGRVWTRDELTRVSDLCLRHGVVMTSDEIHCDVIHKPHSFTPMLALGEDAAQNTIMLISTSKSFNCAGLYGANSIIPNEALRKRFNEAVDMYNMGSVNAFTNAGNKAAYAHGDDWVDQAVAYVGANFEYMRDFIAEHIPAIKVTPLEGTYLAWLDMRGLGLDKDGLHDLIVNRAGIAAMDGADFGEEGAGFYRFNIALGRPLLEQAMVNLRDAVAAL